MEPGKSDLVIYRGRTFRKTYVWKVNGVVQDLTGYTAKLQARPFIDSSDVLFELTTENGGIVITTGVNSQIDLYISKSATSDYDFSVGIQDLCLINGDTIPFTYGKVTLIKTSTDG